MTTERHRSTRKLLIGILSLALVAASPAAATEKVEKLTFGSGGKNRTYEVDSRRMYLFGHSAGAIQGLELAALESQYFAAVAVHAGTIDPGFYPFLDRVPRKIPIAMWVGTNDSLFPVNAVRATRDALNNRGFGTQLTEIKGHTHDYYGRASEINKQVWAFLQQHTLEQDPHYQHYTVDR